eukprot:Phypoly_transcript_06979.p1 GENE.Phypoly_transcript_06979~~Phypoly_transcript_06979.p1  ORF type:complete len:543 (+),score=112.54 Phypoly_transcript_06979:64-1692(+)
MGKRKNKPEKGGNQTKKTKVDTTTTPTPSSTSSSTQNSTQIPTQNPTQNSTQNSTLNATHNSTQYSQISTLLSHITPSGTTFGGPPIFRPAPNTIVTQANSTPSTQNPAKNQTPTSPSTLPNLSASKNTTKTTIKTTPKINETKSTPPTPYPKKSQVQASNLSSSTPISPSSSHDTPLSPVSTIRPLFHFVNLGPKANESEEEEEKATKKQRKNKSEQNDKDMRMDGNTENTEKSEKNKKFSINRALVGSYRWGEKHKIYLPGFPDPLKKKFTSINVGNLPRGQSDFAQQHPNEYLHDIYFEPVQAVLEYAQKDLFSFDILTDRGNLQKIDSALTNTADNSAFTILMRRQGNLLMLKREDSSRGSLVGHMFEQALCMDSPFLSCHALVHATIKLPTGKTVNMLLRGEIDAAESSLISPLKKEYKMHKKTEGNLSVCVAKTSQRLTFDNLREIKMANDLSAAHHFQSWLLGVKKIVHGVALQHRKVDKTRELDDFKPRLQNIVETLQSYVSQMEPDCTYALERANCGPLEFKKTENSKKWLQL